MERLSELFNVNHFIVSQVNPHIIPFLTTQSPTPIFYRALYRMLSLGQSELDLRFSQMIEMGIAPTFLHRCLMVIRQNYVGHVTIVPQWQWRDYFGLMEDPNGDVLKEFVKRGIALFFPISVNSLMVSVGERATWELIPVIKNHLSIELTLDECVYALRCKAVGISSTQVTGSKSKLHQRRVTVNEVTHVGLKSNENLSISTTEIAGLLSDEYGATRVRYKSADTVDPRNEDIFIAGKMSA